MGHNLNHEGTSGFSPCFYLPGFHFGYPCLDPQPFVCKEKHTQLASTATPGTFRNPEPEPFRSHFTEKGLTKQKGLRTHQKKQLAGFLVRYQFSKEPTNQGVERVESTARLALPCFGASLSEHTLQTPCHVSCILPLDS